MFNMGHGMPQYLMKYSLINGIQEANPPAIPDYLRLNHFGFEYRYARLLIEMHHDPLLTSTLTNDAIRTSDAGAIAFDGASQVYCRASNNKFYYGGYFRDNLNYIRSIDMDTGAIATHLVQNDLCYEQMVLFKDTVCTIELKRYDPPCLCCYDAETLKPISEPVFLRSPSSNFIRYKLKVVNDFLYVYGGNKALYVFQRRAWTPFVACLRRHNLPLELIDHAVRKFL